jgi:hypothetical protein
MLIICNGMERSGSTYQYNLARLLVMHADMGHAVTFPSNKRPDEGTWWTEEQLHAWAADEKYYVVKWHRADSIVRELIAHKGVLVLFIYRDIRDVAASLKRARSLRGDELLREVTAQVDAYFELAAIRQLAPRRVLWQRYEEVMRSPEDALKELASFLITSVEGVKYSVGPDTLMHILDR